MNNWHNAPPPDIAQTLRDALMWHAGDTRYAFGRAGVRRIVSISPNATGEPSLGATRAGAGLMSVSALKNVPGIALAASITGISSFTAVIAYPFQPPIYQPADSRYWATSGAITPNFVGYRSGPYFATWRCGFDADNSLNGVLANSAGATAYTNYREVPFNAGACPRGPVLIALTWNTNEIPQLYGLGQSGSVWCSGGVGGGALNGTLTIDTTPWPFHGGYTPDGDHGTSIPTLFNGVWNRALSVRELGALAKRIGSMNRSAPSMLAPRLGNTLAQSLSATDGVRARTLVNGASLRVRLG